MLTEHPGACGFLLRSLESTPDIFDYLLRGLTGDEADKRPDPARFSIREVMAHLAEWDAIFLQRIKQTREVSEPSLTEYNESQLAIDNEYAHTDPLEQSALLRERRTQMVEFLRTFTTEDWGRFCQHPRVGRVTMEGLVTLVLLHDTYHLRQIAMWRQTEIS